MKQVVIENQILNSPFEEPRRHFKFTEDGITDEIVEARRVAVSIGPELGTVGPEQVKEAAKEALKGVEFDLLIVCGFAFDPHVSEEAKRYGKLTVLPAHMSARQVEGLFQAYLTNSYTDQ